MPHVFKALYLVAYFSFLRLSNLCPHTIQDFSPMRHLAQGDVIFQNNSAVLVIKWSKTLQLRKTMHILYLPFLNNDICPILALKQLLSSSPAGSNLPLFQFHSANGWAPLTDVRVRKNFKLILSKLGLQNSNLTLHSFRRSGASSALNHQVALQKIERHGLWSSECVWRYIVDTADAGRQVASMFETSFASP